jgi:hypothetical protein
MLKWHALVATGSALLTLATPSLAQQVRIPCDQRAKIVTALGKDFREMQVGYGLTPAGQLLELFASAQGSWTLLLSLPTGKSCLIANGDDWNVQDRTADRPPLPGQDS